MTVMNGPELDRGKGGGQAQEKHKENGSAATNGEMTSMKSFEGNLTTKNIKMKQYLCVKHALPKTRLTNAILYENVSQQRHLEMKLGSIRTRRHRSSNSFDFSKRTFVAQQNRKQKKWKREDEVRVAAMNLPQIGWDSPERQDMVTVMYHNPAYQTRAETAITGTRKPVLPMMRVRRERTEIVSCGDKTFLTKLPPVVEVDQCKLYRHNTYTGKQFLERGSPSRDERFRRLQTSLSPASSPKHSGRKLAVPFGTAHFSTFSRPVLPPATLLTGATT